MTYQSAVLNNDLISALSANNANYLKVLANGESALFNSGGQLDNFDCLKIYGYPDITTFDFTITSSKGYVKTLKLQINCGTGYSIRYKELEETGWHVYLNSVVSPIRFSEYPLQITNQTIDKTPNPVVIEVFFPKKASYIVEITKVEKSYTTTTAATNQGLLRLIRNSLVTPTSGEPYHGQDYWTNHVTFETSAITSTNFSNRIFASGGVVGASLVSTFSDIKTYSRVGTRDQLRLPGFSSLSRYINAPSGSKITYGGDQFHTLTRPSDGIRLRITCPALFEAEDDGGMDETSVNFSIFYRQINAVTWIQAKHDGDVNYTITDNSTSQVEAFFTIWFPTKDSYVVKIVRGTADSTDTQLQNDTYLSAVVELEHTDIGYINRAVFGMVLRATDQLSGSTPTVTVLVKGRKLRSVKDIVEIGAGAQEKFSKNPADIIVDILTNERYGAGRYFSLKNIDIPSILKFWEYCEELVPMYIPKAEISAFLVDARYDFGDFVLYNTKYYKCKKTFSDSQVGILPTDTTYWSKLAVSGANVVDMQKRFEFNFVVDQTYRLTDFIKKVCETCRTTPYWRGEKLSFFIDKPEVPLQAFSMGNIKPGSFQETTTPFFDISNQIEATYKDKDLDYNEKSVVCVDTERQLTEPVKSTEVQLFGLTDKHRVKRELYYYMRKAKAGLKKISFTTNLSALISDVGDVFWFQYYTPYYGDGGHVIAVTDTAITLSNAIPVSYMLTYGIRVKKQNVEDPTQISDLFFYKTWASGITGEVKTIAVTAGHGISVGDVYQAGLVEKEAKTFRIENLDVKRSEVSISATEYVESVYDEWTQDVQILNYSGFGNRPLSANYVPNVTEITLQEKTVTTGTATTSGITVSFRKVKIFNKTSEYVKNYEIYYKLSTAPTWTKAGTTQRSVFDISGVERGKKYYVAVRVRTNRGNTGFHGNDWFIQDPYSITISGQVDAVYANGCYAYGVFATPQEQAGIGSKAPVCGWLMEPTSVSFSFTDV